MLVVQNATMSIVYTYLVRISYVHLMYLRKTKNAPTVGLEPTTLRFKVSCSTDWASRAAAWRAQETISIETRYWYDWWRECCQDVYPRASPTSNITSWLVTALKCIFLYYHHLISLTKGAYHKYFKYSWCRFAQKVKFLPRFEHGSLD